MFNFFFWLSLNTKSNGPSSHRIKETDSYWCVSCFVHLYLDPLLREWLFCQINKTCKHRHIFLTLKKVVWQKKKVLISCSCTGEMQSSFAWEMHQSLWENILGPQKRKKGPVRIGGCPPTFPPYPQWMQQHKSLWHLRKLILAQGQFQTLPCDAEADGSWLSSPAEEDVLLMHRVMYDWRKRTDGRKCEQNKEKPREKKESQKWFVVTQTEMWTWDTAAGCGVKLWKQSVKPHTWCMNMADLSLKANKGDKTWQPAAEHKQMKQRTEYVTCPLNSSTMMTMLLSLSAASEV